MGAIFRHIVITTDFSEVADRALGLGFDLARQSEARVTLCHVVEYLSRPNPLYATYAAVDKNAPKKEREAEEKARALLTDRIPEDLRSRAELCIRHGQPADEILQAAKDLHADLIVLAPHGSTGLFERLMGGTAYRVVRQATCPVLVVR